MSYNQLVLFLNQALIFIVPLTVVALGGMFTERSGVVNVALEGLMVIGGFAGFLFLYHTDPYAFGSPYIQFTIAALLAGITGILLSLVHAVASIKMKADQIISATAINILTPALTYFLVTTLALGYVSPEGNASNEIPFQAIDGLSYKIAQIPLLSKIPFIGEVLFSNIFPSVIFYFIIVITAYIVLYKTKFGLRLMACGENPHAADAAGINIYKMRYIGVMISGFLAGIGGFFYFAGIANFAENALGYGFLALAIMIFGNWKPLRITIVAIVFSLLNTLGQGISYVPVLEKLGVDASVWSMLPYIATIIILVLTSKNSAAPKAEGVAYDKGER